MDMINSNKIGEITCLSKYVGLVNSAQFFLSPGLARLGAAIKCIARRLKCITGIKMGRSWEKWRLCLGFEVAFGRWGA